MTMLKHGRRAAVAVVCALAAAPAAFAETNSGDTAWILTATALVLLMTLPALALFYGGLVQSKNVLSVLSQCTVIACLMSVLWFAFGYSVAFGDGGESNAIWGGLTSSTPAAAATSRTASMTRWRTSGLRIGGRGRLMSSKAMVSFMPGVSRARKGGESPSGLSRAWRMAPSGSSRASRGSAG
jgi:hypothetical protein